MEGMILDIINVLNKSDSFLSTLGSLIKKYQGTLKVGYAYITSEEFDPILFSSSYDDESIYEYKQDSFTIVYYKDTTSTWNDNDYEALNSFSQVITPYIEKEILYTKLLKARGSHYLTNLPTKIKYIEKIRSLNPNILPQYNAYYLNIKAFGLINGRYGSHFGDKIILSFSEGLEAFTNNDEYVGHLGADTFVAFINKSRNDEFLKFVSDFYANIELNGETINIHLSAVCGIYEIKEPVDTELLITYSKMAYKHAKSTRKSYVFLTEDLIHRINTAKEIEKTFKNDLNDGSFVSYYQPKVDIKSGKIIGCEALARWIKNGVTYQPSSFVPILEDSGQIVDLDLFILENACKDIANYSTAGNNIVPMSCNISRRDLDIPDIEDRILSIIKKYDVASEYIILEITETTNLEEKTKMHRFVHRMRQNHIKVSIDDFGSGYSSLSTLRDFKVNEIKIDRSFIDKKIYGSDKIIISSIIEMAKKLNIRVICEGVETKSQAEFILSLGCNNAQGYLYDKPLNRVDFEERLKKQYYTI